MPVHKCNKLKKTTTDNTVNPPKVITTLYMGGFEYKNDTLQQLAHEEGRIRAQTTGQLTSYHYDYFIKDHLGNTRMVLTEEVQTDQYPAATMELANNATETQYYSKIAETRVAKPAGYTGDANTFAYVSKTNGSGNKIGPGITLKVMAGDKFSIKANSWYKLNGVVPGAATNPLTDLLTALTNGVAALPNSKSTALQLQQAAVFTPGATSFLNNQPAQGTKPKAYLNWVLFDEQFNFVQSSSGAELVGADNTLTAHVKSNMPVNKNGYLYIYLSNATPNIDVFFDNLQVTHVRGALLEESHYYPFGLMMAGISSRAAGKLENKYRFNEGTELNNDFDLSLYETDCRLYDPQLGRFWQIDELAEANWEWTAYNFALNNPISFTDPTGLLDKGPDDPSGELAKVKILPTVTVSAEKKLDHNQMQNLYWQLRDQGNGFGAVQNDALRARLERWDGIQRFMDNVHAQTRATDKIALEVGSWFIPVGWLTKLRYVKYAVNLFKIKRGAISGRVFWSGGKSIAGKAAMEFAKANGMQTLEMTFKGKVLEKLTDITSYKLTKPLWEKASASFARGAEGTVHVFQNATDGVSLKSIWRTIEYNILKNNGNKIIFNDVFK